MTETATEGSIAVGMDHITFRERDRDALVIKGNYAGICENARTNVPGDEEIVPAGTA